MKISRRLLSVILLASIMTGTLACGDSGSGDNTTTPAAQDASTDAPQPEGYPYYDGADFGGEEFTIYNVKKDLWNMICVIQPDELNGETINDAIYNRNEKVKQKLNCEITEVNAADYNTMATDLQTLVVAGDDVYDAVYMPMMLLIGGLTEGYYKCLDDVDTMHLNESWWDQVMLNATSVGGKHYFATSSAHLMGWDGL
ncbi:MAG: hypothetical protein ACI4T6_01515, partial [Candidatus Flemingiibacterium sp.]